MKMVAHRPPPPLGDFVELFWLARREAQQHAKERLLPMGTMELVIDLTYEDSEPILCGVHSESFEINTTEPALILGVHFKPGGAFPFLGVPAGELHNRRLTLDALWGMEAGEMRDRVLEAKTPAGKFKVLEQSLLSNATRALSRHPAVDFALRELSAASYARSITDVIEQTGFSPRRFIELFTAEVGLTPKLFRRVQRFQQLIQRVHGAREIQWAQVALDCGYYDQSHFIHDFRAFSGFTPSDYLKRRGEHLNHVPLAGEGKKSPRPAGPPLP
jgi:AraC-like DNA-binding protein